MNIINFIYNSIWGNFDQKSKNKPNRKKHNKLMTSSGRIYVENDNSKTVGHRGPILIEDYILQEKMAHFNRERIPERVVHAKGSGAYGVFTVTNDISKYTKAKLFNKIGEKTKVFVRFSTVGGEKGSADTERDPRGFAVKFYTEDGNWDLVGNNIPLFFIKDPKKFSDFIHTQKRDPYTNMNSPTMSGISGPKREKIINRQLCHWFRMDEEFGSKVAEGLGVDVNAVMASTNAAHG